MGKKENILRLIFVGAVFFGLAAFSWVKEDDSFSAAERRKLAQSPEISMENILNGQFSSEFDHYVVDQFPLREAFRTLKAYSAYDLFQKKDNNGIYVQNGYAAQILYPLQEKSVEHACTRCNSVYETYIAPRGGQAFAAIIPDKGYYLAEAGGYPALDYERLFALVAEEMPYARQIDLTGVLGLADYYRTDTHWRQEKLRSAAKTLLTAMGKGAAVSTLDELTEKTALPAFRGVYYGQSALPLPAEPMQYLTSEMLEACTVFNAETNGTTGIYQQEMLTDKDPYSFFLSGAAALLTIENPKADTDAELLVFRDSFGSSMIPLLLPAYRRITAVDLRYVNSAYLDQLIDFHGQDALFLYGAALLNDSYTMK